jgi:hypothetical protein
VCVGGGGGEKRVKRGGVKAQVTIDIETSTPLLGVKRQLHLAASVFNTKGNASDSANFV